MSEVIDAVYDPGYVSDARVYNEPQSEQEERPKIGAPNGDSAGELIYPATEGNTKRFALMELASAIGWYNNLQQVRGSLSVEESHELILLEAEYVVLNIEDWEEEHPKFVRAVHDWVERGYNQALSEGKQTSRLDVLRSIMLEFYADNNGADQEPDELLQTMALIEGEYEVADELENLRIVEGGYPELRRRVLATVGSQT